MQIITADQVPVVDNPHSLDVRHLHKTDDVAATQITLQPGEVVKPNKAPVDAFSCVLDHMEQPDTSARSQALVCRCGERDGRPRPREGAGMQERTFIGLDVRPFGPGRSA